MIDVGGRWQYAAIKCPRYILQQFLPRGDNQIGGQEMLAVALLFGTFAEELRGSLVLVFIDNDGVRCAIQHGSGGSFEINTMVGHLWIQCASEHVAFFGVRVETHANIADGPSRGDFYLMSRLGAVARSGVLPDWAVNLWNPLV